MKRPLGQILLALTLWAAQAQTADAHIVSARLGDFYAGALHPLVDLQDLIMWGAMGILAGSLGAARGRSLVVVFPLGLIAGLFLASALGIDATARPALDAGIILVLGLLLAAAIRLPVSLLCALAFGLGVIRGAANASELGPQTDHVLFAAGLAGAGYVAITLIMALAAAFRRPETAPSTSWRGIAVRGLGGWVAAIGLMMMALSLTS
jgi:hydrogenase/urease accessory protein HupE